MGVRLIHGRFFNNSDVAGGSPVIVINETFANRYWPNTDPVGKRMVFGTPNERSQWITIVGVVGDMRRRGLHQGARLETFRSATQNVGRNMQLLVSTEGDPLVLAQSVRAEIRQIDPSGPVTAVTTVDDLIGESLAVRRFQASLLAFFSLLAMLLSAVGIFGLMAQVVARRTPEIGVRMALGARPQDVLKMVLRQGTGLAVAGTVVGILGALVLARGLRSTLFGIGAADPISYAGAALVMVAAVLVACGLPAWRAARVDPIVALRNDG
jgi:predicted permease